METDDVIVKNFRDSAIGRVLSIPIALLNPSQPDDKRSPLSTGPVEAFVDGNKILVLNGNHRSNDMRRRGPGNRKLQVRKVGNPYVG